MCEGQSLLHKMISHLSLLLAAVISALFVINLDLLKDPFRGDILLTTK